MHVNLKNMKKRERTKRANCSCIMQEERMYCTVCVTYIFSLTAVLATTTLVPILAQQLNAQKHGCKFSPKQANTFPHPFTYIFGIIFFC